MNGVEEITMTKFQAAAKYREYRDALSRHNLPYLKELKDSYRQLSKGHGIIDVFKAFRTAGLNQDGEPRLALFPADEETCHFRKCDNGRGYFGWPNRWRLKPVLSFADHFFLDEWPKEKNSWGGTSIRRDAISCKVPIVPAHLLPKAALNNFHILWEVEKWNEEPPRDPLLLRRLSVNIFAVVAKWDLTELERAVIAGRIR
jgi:hypothetical protein